MSAHSGGPTGVAKRRFPPPRGAHTIASRIAELDDTLRCTTPFCGRPTMAAARVGLAETLCNRCVQHRARHGSAWCPSIRATDLKPYLTVAAKWIREHRAELSVHYALIGLRGLLDGAGRPERAQDIKRLPAASKARIAFARLREAGVKPERLLATHVAVAACIEDDAGAHRVRDYALTQTAKALHRLASGTHGRWQYPRDDGTLFPLELHAYPRSSGRVLRVIGNELDEICAGVTASALEAVRTAKLARYGPHGSQLPGWRPHWARQRDAAMGK